MGGGEVSGTTIVKQVNQKSPGRGRSQNTGLWDSVPQTPGLSMFLWEAVLLLNKHRRLNTVSSFHPLWLSQAHMAWSRLSFEPGPTHPLSRSRLTGLTSTNEAIFYGWPSCGCHHFPLLETAELSPILSKLPIRSRECGTETRPAWGVHLNLTCALLQPCNLGQCQRDERKHLHSGF